MFAALFRLFAFGHKPRFADWPEPPAVLPALDFAARALGPLRFGAPLDDIRAFGRPDRHSRIPPDTDELLYAQLELLAQFDVHQGLDYLAFLIAPDPYDPQHPRLRHTTPRLASPPATRSRPRPRKPIFAVSSAPPPTRTATTTKSSSTTSPTTCASSASSPPPAP